MRKKLWLLALATIVPVEPAGATAPSKSCAELSHPPTDLEIISNPVSKVAPRYPQEALANRLEGFVALVMTVSPQGDVTDVKVVKAEPQGVFEQSAVEAAKTWKYCPSGRTITNRLEINFELPPGMRNQPQ